MLDPWIIEEIRRREEEERRQREESHRPFLEVPVEPYPSDHDRIPDREETPQGATVIDFGISFPR